MRSAVLLLAFLLLAGCTGTEAPNATNATLVTPSVAPSAAQPTAEPSGAAEGDATVVVVVVTSSLDRRLPNGTAWEPEGPWVHGCPDTFVIDPAARTVTVDGADAARVHAGAKAALSIQGRHPASFYRNAQLSLPDALPHRVLLGPPNDGGSGSERVELLLEESALRVKGDVLAPGANATHVIRYTWNGTAYNDGRLTTVTLDVRETFLIEHLGVWPDPIRGREPVMCL